MAVQQRRHKPSSKPLTSKELPPDFDKFVEWVNGLRVSRGVKLTIINGSKKAFIRGLRSVEDVKSLPKDTRGWKSMKYGMAKYEEFRALISENASKEERTTPQ